MGTRTIPKGSNKAPRAAPGDFPARFLALRGSLEICVPFWTPPNRAQEGSRACSSSILEFSGGSLWDLFLKSFWSQKSALDLPGRLFGAPGLPEGGDAFSKGPPKVAQGGTRADFSRFLGGLGICSNARVGPGVARAAQGGQK